MFLRSRIDCMTAREQRVAFPDASLRARDQCLRAGMFAKVSLIQRQLHTIVRRYSGDESESRRVKAQHFRMTPECLHLKSKSLRVTTESAGDEVLRVWRAPQSCQRVCGVRRKQSYTEKVPGERTIDSGNVGDNEPQRRDNDAECGFEPGQDGDGRQSRRRHRVADVCDRKHRIEKPKPEFVCGSPRAVPRRQSRS